MATTFQQLFERVLDGANLTSPDMQTAIGSIMDGACSPVAIGGFLTALRVKGETIDEVVGAARAMRDRATPITPKATGLLDTCGTGGDALHTFNISTATALVVAACGVPIAKHGNRGVSSSSGSADVLEGLDVNIQLTPDQVAQCIDEVGIGFCFAPLVHGAMKHAAPVRRELKIRTVFNLLGPLTNPAGAAYQLLGANRPETARILAEALLQLGTRRAAVVCGSGNLDEVSLWGVTDAFLVDHGEIRTEQWTPDSFGLPPCALAQLQVGSPQESVEVIRTIFAASTGPARNMVLANAAAALQVAGRVDSLPAGVQQAAEAIDSGSVEQLCQRLAAASRSF
ncbi:MAG: anthranilate phosphoribosyltransferase [Planctomycetaceae bacterium]